MTIVYIMMGSVKKHFNVKLEGGGARWGGGGGGRKVTVTTLNPTFEEKGQSKLNRTIGTWLTSLMPYCLQGVGWGGTLSF